MDTTTINAGSQTAIPNSTPSQAVSMSLPALGDSIYSSMMKALTDSRAKESLDNSMYEQHLRNEEKLSKDKPQTAGTASSDEKDTKELLARLENRLSEAVENYSKSQSTEERESNLLLREMMGRVSAVSENSIRNRMSMTERLVMADPHTSLAQYDADDNSIRGTNTTTSINPMLTNMLGTVMKRSRSDDVLSEDARIQKQLEDDQWETNVTKPKDILVLKFLRAWERGDIKFGGNGGDGKNSGQSQSMIPQPSKSWLGPLFTLVSFATGALLVKELGPGGLGITSTMGNIGRHLSKYSETLKEGSNAAKNLKNAANETNKVVKNTTKISKDGSKIVNTMKETVDGTTKTVKTTTKIAKDGSKVVETITKSKKEVDAAIKGADALAKVAESGGKLSKIASYGSKLLAPAANAANAASVGRAGTFLKAFGWGGVGMQGALTAYDTYNLYKEGKVNAAINRGVGGGIDTALGAAGMAYAPLGIAQLGIYGGMKGLKALGIADENSPESIGEVVTMTMDMFDAVKENQANREERMVNADKFAMNGLDAMMRKAVSEAAKTNPSVAASKDIAMNALMSSPEVNEAAQRVADAHKKIADRSTGGFFSQVWAGMTMESMNNEFQEAENDFKKGLSNFLSTYDPYKVNIEGGGALGTGFGGNYNGGSVGESGANGESGNVSSPSENVDVSNAGPQFDVSTLPMLMHDSMVAALIDPRVQAYNAQNMINMGREINTTMTGG